MTYILIGLFWVVNFPRTIPLLEADRGLFVSYAERLLAGDKLYADLFFPKDPVFVWLIALGRTFSPLMDILIENFWLILSSVAVYQTSKHLKIGRCHTLLLGFLVTPLILTSGQYYPGYTHLPGIALTLLSVSLLLRNHFFSAGFILITVFFTKVMLFPVAIFLFIGFLILNWRTKFLSRLFFGAGFGSIFWIAVLSVRGELSGYVKMLQFNSIYANDDIYPNWPLPLAHILRASNSMSWTTLILIILILAWTLPSEDNLSTKWRIRVPNNFLWLSTLLGLVAAILVLALTGMWNHHNQVLYIPAIFGAVLFSTKIPYLSNRPLGSFAILLLVSIVLGGPKQGVIFTTPAEMRVAIEKLMTLPDEARALSNEESFSSYARLGSNDDFGHAMGLRKWNLACPYIEFYPKFATSQDPIFESMLECMSKNKPQYILVSTTFKDWLANPGAYGPNNWENFINRTQLLLTEKYICLPKQELLVCERKTT